MSVIFSGCKFFGTAHHNSFEWEAIGSISFVFIVIRATKSQYECMYSVPFVTQIKCTIGHYVKEVNNFFHHMTFNRAHLGQRKFQPTMNGNRFRVRYRVLYEHVPNTASYNIPKYFRDSKKINNTKFRYDFRCCSVIRHYAAD